MTDAVFSKEYAASLVQRARDGATFSEVTRGSWARVGDEDLGSWLPSAWYVRNDYRHQHPGTHWIAWCRRTAASVCLAHALFERGPEWSEAWRLLDSLQNDLRDSVNVIGSLCRLPETWTEAHRDAAREIGGAKP